MRMIQRTDGMTEAEFREVRRSGIGGSDVAAILGVSRYKDAYQVWCEKKGIGPVVVENSYMEEGTIFEPLLLNEWERRNPDRRLFRSVLAVSDEYPFLLGNFDGLVVPNGHEGLIVECKKVGDFTAKEFGEPGSSEVPLQYLAQVQHYLLVSDLKRAELIAKMSDRRICDSPVYVIERDDKMIADLVEVLASFWKRVENDDPPDPSGTKEARQFIGGRYPVDSGETKAADEKIVRACERLAVVKAEASALEGEQLALENLIKDFLGTASILEWNGGKVTWKKVKDSFSVDYKGLVAELKPAPELIDRFSFTKSGSRRFEFRPNKG